MDTLSVGRPAEAEGVVGADPSWRGLYRAGAWCAGLYVALIAVGVGLALAAPQPPLTGGAAVLEYIAAHRLVYLTQFAAFVGLCVPALVVFLALGLALARLDRSAAALGALMGIASEVTALAYNSSPPSLHPGLLALSGQYAAATGGAARAALGTAAETLLAVSNTVNPAGLLTALGIVLISLPMRRGVFPVWVARLGTLTGAAGLLCEALRDVIGPGYFVYGLLLPAWFLAVGWRLAQLGRPPVTGR